MRRRDIAVLLLAAVVLPGVADARIQRSRAAIAEFKQSHPCPANRNRYGPCPGYQIDHIKPLKCKGEDDPKNMQWLTVDAHKVKTKREASWCRH